jgi:hypothetical protein
MMASMRCRNEFGKYRAPKSPEATVLAMLQVGLVT